MKRKGDGVYLSSNGEYWMAVYYDNNGRRVRKSIGPKARWSKTAAQAECNKLAARHIVQPGARDLKHAPTLGAWKERYMRLRQDLSAGSVTLHEDTFRRLYEFFGQTMRLDKVTRAGASDFRLWLAEQPGRRVDDDGNAKKMSEQTISRYMRDCKVIFGWATREDLLPINPFDRIPSSAPKVDKQWVFITREQLENILNACPSQGWRCMFALCRLAGLRWGEAIGLKWGDIDWSARMIRLHFVREDTKHKSRNVPIQPRLYEMLEQAFTAADDGAERVCDLSTNNQIRDAWAIIRRAGIEVYAKPYHTLRKNLESEWLAEFPLLAVCEWLGHSPAVAAAHYHKPTAQTIAKVTLQGPALAEYPVNAEGGTP